MNRFKGMNKMLERLIEAKRDTSRDRIVDPGHE